MRGRDISDISKVIAGFLMMLGGVVVVLWSFFFAIALGGVSHANFGSAPGGILQQLFGSNGWFYWRFLLPGFVLIVVGTRLLRSDRGDKNT
jgi:hypothetical protein